MYTIEGIDDMEGCNLTESCMKSLGFSDDEIDQIWSIIAAILNLGNITHDIDANDEAHVNQEGKKTVARIAQLLMIEDVDQLLKMLEKKVVKYPGQLIETRFNEKDAIIARNSCARVIYGKLFDWIVGKVNHSIG